VSGKRLKCRREITCVDHPPEKEGHPMNFPESNRECSTPARSPRLRKTSHHWGRLKAALAALPYVHMKPERAPATDPAPTAKQTEGGSDPLMTSNKKSSGDRSALEVAASKAAFTRAVFCPIDPNGLLRCITKVDVARGPTCVRHARRFHAAMRPVCLIRTPEIAA
jgi:hypothetical protein